MDKPIEERQWKRSSFTVRFTFSNGAARCEGIDPDTVVSGALKLRYRIQVKHPVDGKFYTMKRMEEPMRLREVQKALDERHNGFLDGKEFVFEVFDKDGKRSLFATKFNAEEKIPSEGFGSEHLVAKSFCWGFELPPDLQPVAKEAIEKYLAPVS